MKTINKTRGDFAAGVVDKAAFIRSMYEEHHSVLFDYCQHLAKTNIKKIEIEDDRVIMTTRDRGIRIACLPGDFRIAPIETLNFLDYERNESAMMERLVADGDSYFDIGANIGYYSMNMALANRNSKIYCFEPIPKTYASLVRNLSLNSLPNVFAHNFGFSSKAGEFPFYYYPEGSGNASSANVTGRSDVEVVQCKVRTLDEYISETGTHIDFIKCDVEGAELLVFQGGGKAIARDNPIIFSEILRKWSVKFNYDPNDIFEFFRQLGYRAFTVNDQMLVEFFKMNDETVETNFFFLHENKHADLIKRYA